MAVMITLGGHAQDYGVHGNVFPVQEEDGREIMIKSAARTDWQAITARLRKQAGGMMENLAGSAPGHARDVHIRLVNPEIVARHDVKAPVLVKGEIKWVRVVREGTRVNPLDISTPAFVDAFVNLESQPEVDLVKELVARQIPLRIIAINGNPATGMETFGQRVYFLGRDQLDTHKVEFTPTFAWAGKNRQAGKLVYAAFPPPFSAERVIELIRHE